MQTPSSKSKMSVPSISDMVSKMSSNGVTPEEYFEYNYAYSVGVQAYIYAYPWLYNAKGYLDRVDGLINEFYHNKTVRNADHLLGGAPSNDTVYTHAVIYIGAEPLVLTLPEISDRYFCGELADFTNDNFEWVGTRTTGTDAGNFLIATDEWDGPVPSDVTRLEKTCSTPWAYVFMRILVDQYDEDDVAKVNALQDQMKLTPLSQWGDDTATPAPVPPFVEVASSEPEDLLDEFRPIINAFEANPPSAKDRSLTKLFRDVGVGIGMDLDVQSDHTKNGLRAAAKDALSIIQAGYVAGKNQYQVNGWNFPDQFIGNYSKAENWTARAMQTCMGFLAVDNIEGIYVNVTVDATGKPLQSDKKYMLTFAAGEHPSVQAFWSVTLYNKFYCLADNPIDRYSIGRHAGQDLGTEITMRIQRDEPDALHKDSWLPTPDATYSDTFFLILRMYLPSYDVMYGRWEPPALQEVV